MVVEEEKNVTQKKELPTDTTLLNKNKTSESNIISNDKKDVYDCNICYESLNEPIVTLCGHLYCWSCFYRWSQRSLESPVCPVCRLPTPLKEVRPIFVNSSRRFVRKEPIIEQNLLIPPRPTRTVVYHEEKNINRNNSRERETETNHRSNLRRVMGILLVIAFYISYALKSYYFESKT